MTQTFLARTIASCFMIFSGPGRAFAARLKRKTIVMLVLAVLSAGGLLFCTASGAGQASGPADQAATDQAAADSGEAPDPADDSLWELPVFMVLQEHPRPGEPITVIYVPAESQNDTDFRAVLTRSGERPISRGVFFEYFRTQGGRPVSAALLTVPSTLDSGEALIHIEGQTGIAGSRRVTVEPRDFVSETIPLNESNTAIRTVPDPQKTREAELLWSIITHTGVDIYTEEPFSAPVSSTRRTSFFGDRRIYAYSDGRSESSVHAGIDYGVPTGTDVLACAPGKTVLAAFRIVTGNTVIIEHLPGVYSLYYHMDRLLVEEGSLTERGTLLGQSGSTGLATGPHLHWEIRVSGENTDPDMMMLRPLLDKDFILSKINSEARAVDSQEARNSYQTEGR
ncbi:MAG: M23 family metallopeptidase [Spirochaetaceae bacterium]|jgi:murein DD-endopeptidase MepM/ murein hydrolase activator NlpD|nr:M23 family metallopeptidase [Spirochaetaceae bacterium]